MPAVVPAAKQVNPIPQNRKRRVRPGASDEAGFPKLACAVQKRRPGKGGVRFSAAKARSFPKRGVLAKDLKQLQVLRDQASLTQQAVIDRFETLFSGLGKDVTSTRKYLVQNQDEVNMPTFHNRIKANYASIEDGFHRALYLRQRRERPHYRRHGQVSCRSAPYQNRRAGLPLRRLHDVSLI